MSAISERMRQILESKRAMRAQLATIPFAEKLQIAARLRERTHALRAARRVPTEGSETRG